MAYTVRISTRFKKDFRRCMKRGLNMKLITDAMDFENVTQIPQISQMFLNTNYHELTQIDTNGKRGNSLINNNDC